MIGVLDYGCGNVGSVLNMFSKLGIWSEKASDPNALSAYSALVLPGVGSFDTGVKKLKETGFWDVLNHAVLHDKKPVLGICLGMQLFFEDSEEGNEKGFGWMPGTVRRFDAQEGLRVPHMSWNKAAFVKPPYDNIENNAYYFVHTYHAPEELPQEYVLARTSYGKTFPSAVSSGNLTGFQFHPEKSLLAGMDLLKIWELSLHH